MSDEATSQEEEGLGARPRRRLKDKREARKAILEAGQKALNAGSIKSADYVALWRASRREENVAEIAEFLENHENTLNDNDEGFSAPDWGALIQKIITNLPLILQLIKAFTA